MTWSQVTGAIATVMLCMVAARGADGPSGQKIVGVLEEVPGIYTGESSHYGVRVLFRQVADEWQPFPNKCGTTDCLKSITSEYPPRSQWIISFEGRVVGSVSAHTPADFGFYSHIGLQDVDAGQSVPKVGDPSTSYSGFADIPVHRPLLATTDAARPAPAHAGWKSQKPDPADLNRIWPSFSRLVPLIDDCRLDARGENIPSNGRAPLRNELEIAGTWVNGSGDAIVQARIGTKAFQNCDGPRLHQSEYWFYREASGQVWPLPGQGDSASKDQHGGLLMPLDFLDLGDGHDVAMFLRGGYDMGGYALFFDGFHKVAHFTWLYH